MAEKRARNYSAEYQRRNQLAQQRGFKNYGQQRRYTEFTGIPAQYVQAPSETFYIPSPRYNYDDYQKGQDRALDAFLRKAKEKDMDPVEAYDRYMRRANGQLLSRGRLKALEMEVFDIGEDETLWY